MDHEKYKKHFYVFGFLDHACGVSKTDHVVFRRFLKKNYFKYLYVDTVSNNVTEAVKN